MIEDKAEFENLRNAGGCGSEKFKGILEETLEEIVNLEYKKTPEEFKAIEFANQITNNIISECGGLASDFFDNNVHIFPPELYKKTTGSRGAGRADLASQSIIINAAKAREKGNLRFANLVFHEMLHIKSFVSFGADNEIVQRGFEVGLKKKSVGENEIYPRLNGLFGGLNEAIVCHYEKYFVSEALSSEAFSKEKEWMDSGEARQIKRKLSQENNIPEEEIYTVNKNGSGDAYSYPLHKTVLEKVAEKIYKDNSEKFNSGEEVIKEFLKAMIVGDTANIAALVEKSFGQGSFQILGMMKEDRQSAIEALECFK